MNIFGKFQLLLLLFLFFTLFSYSLQKGKTYEDLEDKIKNSNTVYDANEPHTTHTTPVQSNEPQKTQQPSSNTIVTPPTYSQSDLPASKSTASSQQTNKKTEDKKKEEDYDDPNALTHAKFHTHGQKNSSDYERAKQIAFASSNKKKNSDHHVLPPITYEKLKDNNNELYFLLAIIILVLTALLIIGSIFGTIYLCIRLYNAKKDRYFEFDDREEEQNAEKNDQKNVLSKIEEVPEEDLKSDDVFKRSQRSSITTQITPSDSNNNNGHVNEDFTHTIENNI